MTEFTLPGGLSEEEYERVSRFHRRLTRAGFEVEEIGLGTGVPKALVREGDSADEPQDAAIRAARAFLAAVERMPTTPVVSGEERETVAALLSTAETFLREAVSDAPTSLGDVAHHDFAKRGR